jgi:hypothetical protein
MPQETECTPRPIGDVCPAQETRRVPLRRNAQEEAEMALATEGGIATKEKPEPRLPDWSEFCGPWAA